MKGHFFANPEYVRSEQLLMRLQALSQRGEDEGDEAMSIHEQLESASRNLSRPEINRLNGLSADLYLLSNEELPDPALPRHRTQQALYEAVKEAQRRGAWDAVLAELRRRPDGTPDETIAFSRARAYDELGHAAVALCFLEFAASRSKDARAYEPLRLSLLVKSGRLADAREAATRHLSPSSPPHLVIASASTLFRVGELTAALNGDLYTMLAGNVERAIRVERALISEPTLAMGYVILIGCFLGLGDRTQAAAVCDEAADVLPRDPHWTILREAMRADSLQPETLRFALESHRAQMDEGEYASYGRAA